MEAGLGCSDESDYCSRVIDENLISVLKILSSRWGWGPSKNAEKKGLPWMEERKRRGRVKGEEEEEEEEEQQQQQQ